MEPIPTDAILAHIRGGNPWWTDPHRIPDEWERLTARPFLAALRPLLEPDAPRRAVLLIGPRRVGKTVLLHHLVQHEVAHGADPRDFAYIALDAPIYGDRRLDELLRLVHEATQRRGLEGCTVMLDEIQYLKDWQRHLKSLVDSHRETRFIASGSAAAALRLVGTESGAGRFTDFFLPPLTFYEFVSLRKEAHAFERAWTVLNEPPSSLGERLNELFIEYLNYGGFPEAVVSPAVRADPARFIRSDVIDKVLLRDLPSLYGIVNIQELNRLFGMLAWHSGQEINLEALSKRSGVAKNTLKRYIDYLQAAFLIDVVPRVDRNARHFERMPGFKVHLTNVAMRAALFVPLTSASEDLGPVVESAYFSQLPVATKRRMHYAGWRSPRAGEVDVVRLTADGRAEMALEIKWSDSIVDASGDLRPLLDFCTWNRLPRAWVSTRSRIARRSERDIELFFVPTALLAWKVGEAQLVGSVMRSSDIATELPL